MSWKLRRLLFVSGMPVFAAVSLFILLRFFRVWDPSAALIFVCWGVAFVVAFLRSLFSMSQSGFVLGALDVIYSAAVLIALALSINTVFFVLGYGHPFFFVNA